MKVSDLILAVLLPVTLIGCAAPRESVTVPTVQPVTEILTLSAEDLADVESAVRRVLKDPKSAMFGRIIAGRHPDKPSLMLVCGWVNAKNSLGGYAGRVPFMALKPIGWTGYASILGLGDYMGRDCAHRGLRL